MKLFRRSWHQAFLSFGAMQAIQLALPLVALPWLGRVLGPESFGLLMYMCIFPPIINLVMDWGLPLGAARAAASEKRSELKLRSLLGDVFAAKIILAFACLGLGLAAIPFLPHADMWPLSFMLAILSGIARGISPLWFFQGTGKFIARMATFDVSSSLLALALILIFVRAPEDWPLYLLFTFACKGACFLFLNLHLWNIWRPCLSFRRGIAMLAKVNALFACSFFSMVCLYGTQLVLAWFLTATQMGVYVAVNKMLRAMASMANPLAQTMYPHICSLRKIKPLLARKMLTVSLGLTLAGMIAAVIAAWILAPWLIGFALGNKYPEAVHVFRIMILASPLLAFDASMASQALAAYDLEAKQAIVLGFMAVAGLVIAGLFSFGGHLDLAAWTPFCIEAGILAGYFIILWKARINFGKLKYCPKPENK